MHKKVEYLCKCIILRLISYLILQSFYICTIYLYNTFMGCTINEIADALSLSRNTVSKVINGKGGVSPKTAEMIVKKAKELGYGQIGESPRRVQATEGGTILLLTRNKAYSGFWMEVMEGIREGMKDLDYSQTIGIVTLEDIRNCHLPPIVFNPEIKGIIIIEICNVEMCREILSLGIPTVSVDMPINCREVLPDLDVVTMENKRNIMRLVDYLIEKGCRKFSFVGDLTSKNVGDGFIKRHQAMVEALAKHGIEEYRPASISDMDVTINSIASRIKKADSLPHCFICGNDYTAIQLIQALNFCGFSVPKDVLVAGFDDILESRNMLPPLTTVSTPKILLGKEVVRLLVDRIQNPGRGSIMVEVSTELELRESTNIANQL